MIEDCIGLILAGGESRRMGCDKTSLEFAGQTLLQRAIGFMQTQFPQVLVSVRQRRTDIDVPQVCDAVPCAGPLAGLCAGLALAKEQHASWGFALAADMPFLNPALIGLLAQRRHGFQAVVPLVRGHPQPLAAFYSVSALPLMQAVLNEAGKHSLRSALERLAVCHVNENELLRADPSLRSFIDLDTPEEVAANSTNSANER